MSEEHPDYTIGDWQYEVCNEHTQLGYHAWVAHCLERDGRGTPGAVSPIEMYGRALDVIAELLPLAECEVETRVECMRKALTSDPEDAEELEELGRILERARELLRSAGHE